MITITRVKQATSEFIKVLRYGKSDVRTADQYLPHGIDSKPVKDKLALYAQTGDLGEPAIIGYLSNTDTTEEGELRLYATDSNGIEVFSVYFKADGTVEFGGTDDYFVRFNVMETAFNQLKTDFNNLIIAFNSHMHATAAVGPPVIPTPIPDVIPAIASTADISGAKIEEIKTL